MSGNCLFSFQIGTKHYCFLEHDSRWHHSQGLVLDMALPPEHPDFSSKFSWKWSPHTERLMLSRSSYVDFSMDIIERMNSEYQLYLARIAAGEDD